jgi:hypothetical protein
MCARRSAAQAANAVTSGGDGTATRTRATVATCGASGTPAARADSAGATAC